MAETFISESLRVAKYGVTIQARTVIIEGVGRYNRLFQNKPPSILAQFTERVPMVKGRLDKNASTATGYAWLIWEKQRECEPKLEWIPPCRKKYERESGYYQPIASVVSKT